MRLESVIGQPSAGYGVSEVDCEVVAVLDAKVRRCRSVWHVTTGGCKAGGGSGPARDTLLKLYGLNSS